LKKHVSYALCNRKHEKIIQRQTLTKLGLNDPNVPYIVIASIPRNSNEGARPRVHDKYFCVEVFSNDELCASYGIWAKPRHCYGKLFQQIVNMSKNDNLKIFGIQFSVNNQRVYADQKLYLKSGSTITGNVFVCCIVT